jgi:chromosome segregation ATPase
MGFFEDFGAGFLAAVSDPIGGISSLIAGEGDKFVANNALAQAAVPNNTPIQHYQTLFNQAKSRTELLQSQTQSLVNQAENEKQQLLNMIDSYNQNSQAMKNNQQQLNTTNEGFETLEQIDSAFDKIDDKLSNITGNINNTIDYFKEDNKRTMALFGGVAGISFLITQL